MAWSRRVWVVLILAIAVEAAIVKDDVSDVGKSERSEVGGGGEESEIENSEEIDPKEPDVVTVTTTHGVVRGHIKKDIYPVLSFIDIPYGKFTKFEEPTYAEPWEDVHDVTEHNIICPQLTESNNAIGTNDCLVLSVFTPENINTTYTSSVLFHIHDGNFVDGSGDFNVYGPEYLVRQGIILVLPNYRLGPLGFLCLQDEVAAGNAALKDLTLALNWVKYNIENFGGNPDKITVSAEGKAGALVGLLAISSKSNHLFKQAITESGAMLAPWSLDRNPIDTGLRLVKSVSETKNSSILLETDISKIMQGAKVENITFKPCVENGVESFINATPWSIINKENFVTNITFMMGSADMSGMHKALKLSKENLKKLNSNIRLLLPSDLAFPNNATGNTLVAKKIKDLYFNDKDISDETREELTLLYTDSEYLGPSLRLARNLSKAGGRVYLYEFACDSERNIKKIALETTMPGAARGDIIGYIFTQRPIKENEDDFATVLLLDFWASFINNGQPAAENLSWKPLSNDEEPVMMINTDTVLKNYIHPDRMDVWTKIYDRHFIERSLAIEILPSHIIVGVAYIILSLF